MNDHQSLVEQQHVPADDGWDDAAGEASERTIRGHLLKFADWRWTLGKEATPVDNGTRLIALATAAMWVRWEDGKPVEHIVRRPGERLPEREKLSHTNEKEWETGPGNEPKDPWANTRTRLPRRSRHCRGLHLFNLVLGRTRRRHRSRRPDHSQAQQAPRRRADCRIARGGDAYQARPQIQAGSQGCRLEERQRQTHRNRQACRADQAGCHQRPRNVGRSRSAADSAADRKLRRPGRRHSILRSETARG